MGMVSELRAGVQRESEARHSLETQLLSLQREMDSRRSADSQIVELRQAMAQEVAARNRSDQECRNLEGCQRCVHKHSNQHFIFSIFKALI